MEAEQQQSAGATPTGVVEEKLPTEEVEKKRDPLVVPPPDVLRDIAAKQDARAQELAERRRSKPKPGEEQRDNAAKLIQKNYRGYRARRELNGFGLDPGTRWMELMKDAKYYNSTAPLSREHRSGSSPTSPAESRARWKRLGAIARRAGDDDTSESDVEVGTEDDRAKLKERKRQQKREREKYAKIMGLEYFLEMVDVKHRYGSNLRRYHVEWKKADTNENYFYWLDHGEGALLDLEDRPRTRLDTERVRYLSRDDRLHYLVYVNEDGLFCFSKNDQPTTTSMEFKDSIEGIVPIDDDTPTWREVTTGVKPEPSSPGSSTSSLSSISTGSQEDSSKYVNTDLHDAKGLAKFNHMSVDAIKNNLLRKTTKKNSWIFVADTSFRMYIGIKQSGAFQHSSFLRGARVAAAGQIKIKGGQLRKLSPLSGHYAPPLKNFEEFMKSLKEHGADLSRLSLSRSYAVLLGLEGYLGAKQQAKMMQQGVKDVLNPDKKREREEAAKDKSKSAAKEREVLEQQERQRRQRSWSHRVMKKLGFERDGVKGVKEGK